MEIIGRIRRWSEPYKPYLFCGALALLFAGLAVRDTIRQRELQQAALRGQVVPHVKAQELLAGRMQFDGDIKSPYTLVEFGDYECPPCRRTQPMITEMLRKYPGRVKLDFRQFPLTTLHPHAEGAAAAAESARASGKFWEVHKALYAADLNLPGTDDRILASAGVTMNRRVAVNQIHADNALANKLLVRGTPTLFLCCPGGRVIRLPSVNAISLNLMR